MAETVGKEGESGRETRRVTKLVQAVTALAEPIVASFGCELDRVEYRQAPRRAVLQVFIDKPGGVTHEDCAHVSRQLSAELDVNDFIPVGYDLEVSSPGLDRPLHGEADFRKFAGKAASLTCRRAVAGSGSKVSGILRGVEEGEVLVQVKDGTVVRIGLDLVAKARLEPEI
jgi:ribosome maturation factor RimP